MARCVFVVLRRKGPDEELTAKCSLTGSCCYCEIDYLQCSRRTWSLGYFEKQDKIARMVLIDPVSHLPST